MFEFTEAIEIQASPQAVWEVMRDLENWWLQSNPEHDSLERLDDRGIVPGARLRIREKIAGIPGEYTGTLTHVEPGSQVTLEAPAARYHWLGRSFTVGEGVTWRIEPQGRGVSRLSARVWATFPASPAGRIAEWAFTRLFRGVARDREHARTELRYLKRIIEQPPAVCERPC